MRRRRQKAEATAALVAATVARTDPATTDAEVMAEEAKAATEAVSAITPRTLRRASRSKILWVDDRPSNNVREQRALEALGIEVSTSTSTEDALAKLQRRKFDVVISDMGRPSDSQAGYTLLEKMRNSGNNTPYVIYAGSRAPEYIQAAKRCGAMGSTNRPDELFDYVLRAIGRSA